jgi:hypothetical protein
MTAVRPAIAYTLTLAHPVRCSWLSLCFSLHTRTSYLWCPRLMLPACLWSVRCPCLRLRIRVYIFTTITTPVPPNPDWNLSFYPVSLIQRWCCRMADTFRVHAPVLLRVRAGPYEAPQAARSRGATQACTRRQSDATRWDAAWILCSITH